MSRQQANREKEQLINAISIDIQDTFETKQEYVQKLKELVETEAEIDKLNTEVIAEKNIQYEFEERL